MENLVRDGVVVYSWEKEPKQCGGFAKSRPKSPFSMVIEIYSRTCNFRAVVWSVSLSEEQRKERCKCWVLSIVNDVDQTILHVLYLGDSHSC